MTRLEKLPPYLFSAIDEAKARAVAAGVDVVDLGIGDPDRPTPGRLVECMAGAVADPRWHSYPAGTGTPALRQAIADWLRIRHAVKADPDGEILALIGSKEGLAHLPLTCVQEGDNVLVPNLGYPVYTQATILAGGQPREFALRPERGFLPDPAEIAGLVDERTRLIFLNYPNNPTGAVADAKFWREIASVTASRGVILVNDAAYQEVVFGGVRPRTLLEEIDHKHMPVIELHSLSKMFNMTGWRLAFAVGNPRVVGNLARVKESIDSGAFGAVQHVAAFALGEDFESLLAETLAPYPSRKQTMLAALADAGFEVFANDATFYIWARTPAGEGSIDFCRRALRDIGVVVTPGLGFGVGGEGWFRISLTASDESVAAGAERFRKWD